VHHADACLVVRRRREAVLEREHAKAILLRGRPEEARGDRGVALLVADPQRARGERSCRAGLTRRLPLEVVRALVDRDVRRRLAVRERGDERLVGAARVDVDRGCIGRRVHDAELCGVGPGIDDVIIVAAGGEGGREHEPGGEREQTGGRTHDSSGGEVGDRAAGIGRAGTPH